MDEPRCAAIFHQLMQAIDYCHRHNVSHRDIKLENVIIDSNGKVTLIDFGFATVSSVKNKKSFVYCGTPNYMAPEIVKREQFAGEPADVWAAGVLLFMMLVGKFPFASPKESGVFHRILKNDVVFPDFLSFKCLMLLKAMLEPCPCKRITAKLVLRHPWVVQKGKSISKNTPLLGDDGDVECF
jgi:serine/threonine protein kinase